MASNLGTIPSVTNTFSALSKARAADVNTNFSDLLDALRDGAHDLTIGTTYQKVANLTETAYSMTSFDSIRYVMAQPTTTGMTVYLPTATQNEGRLIDIRKTRDTTGTITIDGNGYTIDGTATIDVVEYQTHVSLLSDGSNWQIVGIRFPETSYVGLSITASTGAWQTSFSSAKFYADLDGSWRVNLTVQGAFTSGTNTSRLLLDGLTFKNVTNLRQSIQCYGVGSNYGAAVATPNSDRIDVVLGSTSTFFSFNGEFLLESKPTTYF